MNDDFVTDLGADVDSDLGASEIDADTGAGMDTDLGNSAGEDLNGGMINDGLDAGMNTNESAVDDLGAGAPVESGEDLNAVAGDNLEQPEVNELSDGDLSDSDTPETLDPKDIQDDYGSSFNDRIKQTPVNDGDWDGDRGDSRWKPNDEDVLRDLRDYGNGAEDIEYSNGFPDFTPVQVFECKMPNQLNERNDDYQFTDCNLALSDHLKDHPDSISNFDDTQLAAIAKGNNPSGYTWHHDVQTGRMQLVPTSIHDSCKHYGGKNVWGGGTANR